MTSFQSRIHLDVFYDFSLSFFKREIANISYPTFENFPTLLVAYNCSNTRCLTPERMIWHTVSVSYSDNSFVWNLNVLFFFTKHAAAFYVSIYYRYSSLSFCNFLMYASSSHELWCYTKKVDTIMQNMI